VYETENIVLNQFYTDLLNEMATGSPTGGINLQLNALAVGIGTTAALRTDTGLASEWQGTTVALTSASLTGGIAITSVPCTPLSVALPASAAIVVGGTAMTVDVAGAAIGATAIPVLSVTPITTIASGATITYAAVSVTPQRASLTATTPNFADPPQMVYSFYLPAGANAVPVQFQEAGLLYNASSLAAATAPSRWATHAVFAYQKGLNVDVRIDYTLARSLT
jgi:hypothetical protein